MVLLFYIPAGLLLLMALPETRGMRGQADSLAALERLEGRQQLPGG